MWAEAVRATFTFLLLLASFSVAALDEPDYTVIETLGDSMEVREYPAFTTASVAIDADMKSAGIQGFRLLADYIFGNNQADKKIAMTGSGVPDPNRRGCAEGLFLSHALGGRSTAAGKRKG